MEKGGGSILFSIIPTILRQGRSPDICHQDWIEARLANVRAASAVEHCDPLWSPYTIPYFPDIFGPQPTFTWTGEEDILIIRYLQQSLTTEHATTSSSYTAKGLVLGSTTIHPRPLNHLRHYSRRSLWTKIL